MNKYIGGQQQVYNFQIIKNPKTLKDRLGQKSLKYSYY